MKKILIILIFINIGLFASGLSAPFEFLTSLEKQIVIKNEVLIISKNSGEMIVPLTTVRIMKNDTQTGLNKFILVIRDYILFEEQKIFYITEQQYEYLKIQLYNL